MRHRRRAVIAGVVTALLTIPLMLTSGASAGEGASPTNPGVSKGPDFDSEGRSTAERSADARAHQSAEQKAKTARMVAELPKTPPVLKPIGAPSGHVPYAGAMYAAYGGPTGSVYGCTLGMPTRSAANLKYYLTAGHCVRAQSGANNIDPSTGQFFYPYTLCVSCQPPFIGNTGHGGTAYGAAGDYTFIRANMLPYQVYSELGTYDSRGSVDIGGWGNPTVGDAIIIAGGHSRKIFHGTVVKVNFSAPYATTSGTGQFLVGNSAWAQISDGCPIPGDSGAPVARGFDRSVQGVAGAAGISSGKCNVYFNMVQKPMAASSQFSVPQAP